MPSVSSNSKMAMPTLGKKTSRQQDSLDQRGFYLLTVFRLKGARRLLSDELPVLWVINVLTNECLHVGGTINSCEPAIKHKLGDPGCRFDLNFQDVRLRREEHAQLQLLGRNLVGDCMRGLDEHLVGHPLRVRSVNGHANGGEDIQVVGL
jgi:hypothetical protein